MTSPSPWSRLKKPLSDVALVAGEVPRTAHRIASAGYEVRTIAADELAKAEVLAGFVRIIDGDQ
jgi:hypothetical protein